MYLCPRMLGTTRVLCAAVLLAGSLLLPACGPTNGADPVTGGNPVWLPDVKEPWVDGGTGEGGTPRAGGAAAGGPPTAQTVTTGDPTVTRPGDPILFVTTDTLVFGFSSTARSFGVRNDGGGTLVYSVQCEVPWVTTTPQSGRNTGDIDQVVATVDRALLTPGTHHATITVTSLDGQQRTITVSVRVVGPGAGGPGGGADTGDPGAGAGAPAGGGGDPGSSAVAQPELAVSPDWLSVGSVSKTVTFSVLNATGQGLVTYSVESPVSWATVTPASGTVSTNVDTITVKIDRDQLYTGQHVAQLLVRDAAGPVLTVTLVVEKPLTSPRIVPWLEVNIADEAEIQNALAGLRVWRYVTDTACISTGIGRAALFTRLRAEMPDMKIIPGFKTSGRVYHPGLDSIAGWQLVASDIAELAAVAGTNQVLLENESAIDRYLKGQVAVNLDQLRAALQQLPPHIEIIWYPGVSTTLDPGIQQRSTDLCRVVAETINPRFVDLSYADPGWPTWPPSWYARETLAAISPKPTFPIVYFGASDNWQWWYESQVRTVLQQLSGKPDTLFYPGRARWVQSAQLIVQELREAP